MPDSSRPACVCSASTRVDVADTSAVCALPTALVAVCGPASSSRSSTRTLPYWSTTPTLACQSCARQAVSTAWATASAVSSFIARWATKVSARAVPGVIAGRAADTATTSARKEFIMVFSGNASGPAS